jgi:hypothetical protein
VTHGALGTALCCSGRLSGSLAALALVGVVGGAMGFAGSSWRVLMRLDDDARPAGLSWPTVRHQRSHFPGKRVRSASVFLVAESSQSILATWSGGYTAAVASGGSRGSVPLTAVSTRAIPCSELLSSTTSPVASLLFD